MKKSTITEKAVFAAFNAYSKAISKTATETERENTRRAFEIAIIHVESGRESEKRLETAKANIRAAVNTYKMYMTVTENRVYSHKLENALKEYRDAARGIESWNTYINMSYDEKLAFATEKARAQAVKQSEKAGKSAADYMQYSDDAAQAALMYIEYEMKEKSERAAESILSYIAAKTLSNNVYRGGGRKGKETTIDNDDDNENEIGNTDKLLYIGRAYIPNATKTTIVHDTYNEIIKELKPRDRERAARLLSMMKDGYSIEQAAERLNISRRTGFYLFNRIASAAAIVKEQDSESAAIEKTIEKDCNMRINKETRESWKRKETPETPKETAPKAVTFKETAQAPIDFDEYAARREYAFIFYCDAEKARAAYKRKPRLHN